ncbi:MAG: TonB-dependent receptor [Pseudomonadota bacterium]
MTPFASCCAARLCGCVALAVVAAPAAMAAAAVDAPAATLRDVLVTSSPLPGTAIDVDRIPGNVRTLSTDDLAATAALGLTGALLGRVASVNLNDNLGSDFQPDLLYRGFAASPVLGTPQGLAVYQNGVRVNEAFGDAVNWDLIPDVAIRRIDLVSANPIYGLNALGGGVAIQMKDGFSYRGAEAEVSGGSFRQRSVTLQAGGNDGRLGFYAAGRGLDRTGWRQHSSDRLRQLYLDGSLRDGSLAADLSYTRADNALFGQGAVPMQELALDRSLAFTGPQGDRNRVDFLTLNVTYALGRLLSMQLAAYDRTFSQATDNGNRTAYIACQADVLAGSLCQEDGATAVTDVAGVALPDLSAGGSLPIGENDRQRIDAAGRGFALQLTSTRPFGRYESQFSAGVSVDAARVDFSSSVEVGAIDSQLFVQPSGWFVATAEGAPFNVTPVALRARHDYYGLYATETLELAPGLALTASGRYNLVQIHLRDQRGTALNGDSRYSHFNPALGFTYRLRPTVTGYAQLARNTRTPSASEIECSDPARPCLLPSSLSADPPTLRQVVAQTFEAGLRGRSGGSDGVPKLVWSVGVFRTRVADDIYGIATTASTGYFRNIDATRRQGIEFDLQVAGRRWSGSASYAYLDATFESSLLLHSPSNPLADPAGNIDVRSGNRLPGLPRHRLRLAVEYDCDGRWFAGASVLASGSAYYRGDESNLNAPLPAHVVVGLHGSYFLSATMSLYGSVQNALGARYSTFGLYGDPTGLGVPGVPADGMAAVDTRFQSPAAPAAVFAGVRIRF